MSPRARRCHLLSLRRHLELDARQPPLPPPHLRRPTQMGLPSPHSAPPTPSSSYQSRRQPAATNLNDRWWLHGQQWHVARLAVASQIVEYHVVEPHEQRKLLADGVLLHVTGSTSRKPGDAFITGYKTALSNSEAGTNYMTIPDLAVIVIVSDASLVNDHNSLDPPEQPSIMCECQYFVCQGNAVTRPRFRAVPRLFLGVLLLKVASKQKLM